MDEKETLDRAASGDEDALDRLRGLLSRLSEEDSRRVAEILKRAKKETEARFWSDLIDLKDVVGSVPASTENALKAMEDRAREIGTCETVQVLLLRSYRSRVLDDLVAAQMLLDQAERLALGCRLLQHHELEKLGLNPCLLETHRRRAVLETTLGRGELGLEFAETALLGYRLFGKPGHNLNGNGETSSLYDRGEIRYELRDFSGAAADFASCVDRFPSGSQTWFRAQQDLATALSKTGQEGRERAFRLMSKQRLAMRSGGLSTERAAFLWTDGQLSLSLRKPRKRALKKLRDSLECFAALEMPDPFGGVTLDICRAHFPRRDKMEEFLAETEKIRTALLSHWRHKDLVGEIAGLAEGCPKPDTLLRLDWLLRHLRGVLTKEASLPPCLIEPFLHEPQYGAAS